MSQLAIIKDKVEEIKTGLSEECIGLDEMQEYIDDLLSLIESLELDNKLHG